MKKNKPQREKLFEESTQTHSVTRSSLCALLRDTSDVEASECEAKLGSQIEETIKIEPVQTLPKWSNGSKTEDWVGRPSYVCHWKKERFTERGGGCNRGEIMSHGFLSLPSLSLCSQGPLSSIRAAIKRSEY